jgi:hypothetical protein
MSECAPTPAIRQGTSRDEAVTFVTEVGDHDGSTARGN